MVLHKNRTNVSKDLGEVFKQLLLETLHEANKNRPTVVVNSSTSSEQNELMSTSIACKVLDISRSTLWRWTENGVLTKIYIHGTPRYLRKEVEGLIESRMGSKANAA